MTKGNYEEVAKNVAHLITIVGQSMIYCGYANDLTDQVSRPPNVEHLILNWVIFLPAWLTQNKKFFARLR